MGPRIAAVPRAGWAAGPAGTAPLVLGPGVVLDLDVAASRTVVQLEVEAPSEGDPVLDGSTVALLDVLLGEEVRRRLLALAAGAGGARPLRDRRRGGAGVAAVLGQAALARTVEADAEVDPLARAVAGVEAAEARAVLASLGVGSAEPGLDEAAAVAALLVFDPEDVDEHVRPVLAELLGAVSARLRFRRVLADDVRAWAEGRRRPERVQRLAMMEAPLPPADRRARRAAGVHPAGDSELRVVLDAGADPDGLWARAVDPETNVVVALAPFRSVDDVPTARLLVPPERRAVLRVDVTRAPHEPVPSRVRVSVDHALAAGRAAARAERTGDLATSAERWSACASGWADAGDDRRRQLAEAYAVGGDGGRRASLRDDRIPEPLLSDLLG